MTADLRAAAARIRDLAAGATPGPWHADGLYKLLPGCRCLSCDEDEPWAYTLREVDGPESGDCIYPVHVKEPDARHIAAWSPDRALAVADLLEAIATQRPDVVRGYANALAELVGGA